ncbi:MAG TPA: DUF2612 domain-containing protein [Caulobacteraceae bacterium]|jgi:hypothetical protein|nr:DUF2612 domain-containing protein [Caulobacteraceae bacterium]
MDNIERTVIQQYGASTALLSLIDNFNEAVDPGEDIDAWYADVWSLATAQGYGLDLWGRIVDVPRILTVSGYGNYSLSDPAYLTLIYAKALSNISDGSIRTFNQILMTLFPGVGDCYVVDNLDMTMSVILPFTPTAVQYAMIALPGLLPRPAGVLLNLPGSGSGSLAIAIAAGETESGTVTSWTFDTNTATVTGGSGSYAFTWSLASASGGAFTLTGGGTASATVAVSGVGSGVTATVHLSCQVLDTITGTTATSSSVTYSFDNTTAIPFTIAIGSGATASAASTSHTFGGNTATVTGGVGPFLISWTITPNDSSGTWSLANASTATTTPSVSGVAAGATSTASLVCMVTDTTTGLSHSSAAVTYSFNDSALSLVTSDGVYSYVVVAPSTGYGFPTLTVVAFGGSGSYTYSFTLETYPGNAPFWRITPSGATCGVAASGVGSGHSAIMYVSATVTDTMTGQTATATAVLYQFGNNSGGGNPSL